MVLHKTCWQVVVLCAANSVHWFRTYSRRLCSVQVHVVPTVVDCVDWATKTPHELMQLKYIVGFCRTSQHGGEAAQVGAAAPSVAEALDALKVPREVKKTN